MKYFVMAAGCVVLAAVFAGAAFAQNKSKDDYIKEISTLSNTKKPEDIEKAYQLSKECLAKYGKEKEDKITKLRTWANNYRMGAFYKAVDGGKVVDAFGYGHDILADEPNNTEVIINLAYAGYSGSATPEGAKLIDETIGHARKAAQLLETGMLPKSFAPFSSKEESQAYMYFIDGSLSMPKEPKSAVANVYKATQVNSPVKNTALPYYLIASYYEDVYAKMSGDLKAKAASTKMTDAEFKAENDKVNAVVDLMLDAYARTVTRAEKEKNPGLAQWKDRLVQVFKFRNKTETGVDGFVISANSKPMTPPVN